MNLEDRFTDVNNKIHLISGIEELRNNQINFKDFIKTEIKQYIKEGSLKTIDNDPDFIYIKLPNWGDIKLSFCKHPITFKGLDKNEQITIEFKYLRTTLKHKVIVGDNSGYKKYYFIPLIWMESGGSTIQGCIQSINLLLKNNSIIELSLDNNAIYFDEMSGGGD